MADGFDGPADGDHDIYCPECEKEFRITIDVSYSFTSPAVNAEAGEAATDG